MLRAIVLAMFAGPVAAEPVLFAEAMGKPVVILGEVHDNPEHHAIQAANVAMLEPRAIVFEMLTRDQATLATPEARADLSSLGVVLGWEDAGWPDFAIYAPIFAAAPKARIYGAGLPRDVAQRAFAEGTAAVFGPDAARFGLDHPLEPDDQAAREAEQADAHCGALPADILPGFVAAQRLRDAELARVTLQALDETGGPVVVITGNGHARRDIGVPSVLAIAGPGIAVYSVGLIETDGGTPITDAPFDRWTATDPTPRPDPCAVFQ
jgi:uncharacterized iron-regulated protein